jgi:sec-independent protein translocase protein TatA
MEALLNLSREEIILILALVLILFGARRLPDIARGLREGFFQFRKATRDIARYIDQDSYDAGRSLGGINGRPAAQALTADNQVAELYDPAVFGQKPFRYRRFSRWCAFLLLRIAAMISRVFRRIAFWRH